ncbi:DUF5615 family PIN-like protein [Larkinella punicea]|uniref:DUF5615 domain-containing protein n=1 Tax=Larkinella punicea TaxID=2315727 RepID=A0A368JXW3_9BACT|nr:DUF5615 family PIN-like protein [Larkinella punicea]RCR71473.1 hypothetical protein DUE52_00625 [Larkinella punicea]
MRFLANENFPGPSIRRLRAEGYDVISISETNGGWKDTQVLAQAVAEQLIILTFDRDYGELLFRYRLESPPAVVYFRRKGNTPDDAAKILIDLLSTGKIDILNHFTVIDEDGIRQRKL